jgi:hypothetical protein
MTTTTSTPTPTFDKPIRQTFFVADLKCYMCGSVSGSIESEQTLTPHGRSRAPVLLRQPGETKMTPVDDWRRLRCVRCAGPLFLDESDVIIRRTDAYNWLDERPRRGRPPKRLLEERRRERELRDSQAA